jgi:predicted transcriptional regulator
MQIRYGLAIDLRKLRVMVILRLAAVDWPINIAGVSTIVISRIDRELPMKT